jgi:hypothetical protein
MTTITWSITGIDVLPQVDEYSDFAWRVSWDCSATDGTNTQTIGSVVTFYPAQQGQPYTPYDQLTEAQVIEWVQQALGPEQTAKTETVVTQALTATPAPLPWA